MKKTLSILLAAALAVNLFIGSAAAAEPENICRGKSVVCSSRLQYNELYPHNLTDGSRTLRASSYFIDPENPYEWFRISLGGEKTVSQITIYTSVEIIPSNLAVDVWSGGGWVRVARDYNISSSDFPISYYFDEIKASYIQISTNGIPNAGADIPQNAYVFSLSEVEAYYTADIPEEKKSGMLEEVPSDSRDIPLPDDINRFMFKQGLKSDSSVCPDIPENEFISPVGQYGAADYSAEDIKYLRAVYKNSEFTGNTVALAGAKFLKPE